MRSRLIPSLLMLLIAPWAAAFGQAYDFTAMREAQQLMREEKWKEAADALSHVVRRDPRNGEAWLQLGTALYVSRDYDRSIYALQRAAEIDPFRGQAHFGIGRVQAASGRIEEAFAALAEAIRHGFDERVRFELDEELASLRSDSRWPELFAALGPHRQLDFWIGEWDVVDAGGETIGRHSIGRRGGDRLLRMRWRIGSDTRTGGEGFAYYDPTDDTWKLYWFDGSGDLWRHHGRYADGKLSLTGDFLRADGEVFETQAALIVEGRRLHWKVELRDANGWVIDHEHVFTRAEGWRPR